ncbi:TIGR03986 family CRISPR-associated RAMP protein [Micromonospora sp. LOL_014]|uniref:TIGR03986 family type III CRISPR-associated RAMP protein n=1 Tax=Micromonospora sp. LOL_014 TaxID=3345415 RepID=UPI003A878C55
MSDQHLPDGSIDAAGPTELKDAEGHFLNPYGFVSIPEGAALPPELADGPPASHDRYDPDRWTGTIRVRVTTRTPMLIPDHGRRAADGTAPNAPLPVRVDQAGRPVLAGSAVKGALRSAYEAVTNSRFGVFTGHDQQLAIRATTDHAQRLRPAVVTEVNGDGSATLQVVDALDPKDWQGDPLEKPVQTAVWVPMDLPCECVGGCSGKVGHAVAGSQESTRSPEMEAWIYFALLGPFPLWRVAVYARPGELCDESVAEQRRVADRQDERARAIERARKAQEKGKKKNNNTGLIVTNHPLVRVRGRLHVTGSTFPAGEGRKRFERFVVTQVEEGPAKPGLSAPTVSKALVDGWRAVIDSYERAHETESSLTGGYGSYVWDAKRWRTLHVGDTLYVEPRRGAPVGLYPAMIGRVPFPGAPVTSLPHRHQPATDRTQLSPADRVFGWVRQGEDDSRVAHRGHLRVLPPDGDGVPGKDKVHRLIRPLELVVLNGPKPSQFLFYLGDRDGAPLEAPDRRAGQGYPAAAGARRLRGRKTYLTHAEVLDGEPGAADYWTPPAQPPRPATPNGPPPPKPRPMAVGGRTRFREYARPPVDRNARDNTEITTSVSHWVKPGTTFALTLQVDNLTGTELGALLWLLSLPDGACLKLGLGKPLGFGAVRVEVDWDDTRLFTGDRLLDRYRILSLSPPPADADLSAARQLVTSYDDVLREHLTDVREEFLNAAYGFVGAPVHYPRKADGSPAGVPATPRNTTYDWWVANDKIGNEAGKEYGRRLSLGELSDPGSLPLPYDPTGIRPGKPKGSQPGASTGSRPGGAWPGEPQDDPPRPRRRKMGGRRGQGGNGHRYDDRGRGGGRR